MFSALIHWALKSTQWINTEHFHIIFTPSVVGLIKMLHRECVALVGLLNTPIHLKNTIEAHLLPRFEPMFTMIIFDNLECELLTKGGAKVNRWGNNLWGRGAESLLGGQGPWHFFGAKIVIEALTEQYFQDKDDGTANFNNFA